MEQAGGNPPPAPAKDKSYLEASAVSPIGRDEQVRPFQVFLLK